MIWLLLRVYKLWKLNYFYNWLSWGLLWKESDKIFFEETCDQCQLKLWAQLLTKNNDPLYIIQWSYQALRYSIVFIDESCQTAIIFNNIGIHTFVGTWSKKYLHISLAKCWNNWKQWVIRMSDKEANYLFVWP